ncbi:MAG TPA: pyruvate kinase [Actinomycetota bacterium]
MKIQILCTLGPASMSEDVIRQLDRAGVDLFRINLSHTRFETLDGAIDLVRRATGKPLCLDLEGAQVRTGPVARGLALEEGQPVQLVAAEVDGTAATLTLRPASVFTSLAPGHRIAIDFDGAQVEVTRVRVDSADPASGMAEAVVTSGGRVGANRAVTVEPSPELPTLSVKDQQAIVLGLRRGVEQVALSFASCADDVALVRSLLTEGTGLIAKIESSAGVRNLDGIIAAADAVLIDRGDLSREVPLEHVPYYQKAIVRRANRWHRPVFVATNLLESMVSNRNPTIAEANDIANTLLDGVHGLVLAAETAIGRDPVGIVGMVSRSIQAFEQSSFANLLERDQPLLTTR